MMRQGNYDMPLVGPNSDPVLCGVAAGLAEMFPPVELSSLSDEADEQIGEGDDFEQSA